MSRDVHDMFASIARSYDRANGVLSLGVHHRWRKRTVSESMVKNGDTVLDCATGTGDLAMEFKSIVGPDGHVVGTDFCEEMLVHASKKAMKRSLDIVWEVQDVQHLTYPANSFDIASIAFGIRNVDDPLAALREMGRVVRSGGRVVVLEFGTPSWWMKPLFAVYSKAIIPVLGGIISGNAKAYRYLTRTSAAFPTGDAFLALLDQCGMFSRRRTIPLTGGIAHLYIGIVR